MKRSAFLARFTVSAWILILVCTFSIAFFVINKSHDGLPEMVDSSSLETLPINPSTSLQKNPQS
ncbi:hypothetical protein P9112_013405 [Eukaryota sp. TZLM1-RC]